MRKRIMTVALGAVLWMGAIATAQDPPFTVQGDRVAVATGQTTLTGHVFLEVNGVLVRADRAVIKDREVALEGNVRLTLPQPK